jgi:hypothetical protein
MSQNEKQQKNESEARGSLDDGALSSVSAGAVELFLEIEGVAGESTDAARTREPTPSLRK